MLGLLAILVILGPLGARAISAQWDDISVTCHGLEGDLPLVDGVSFAMTSRYTNLAWDLAIPLTTPQDMTIQTHQDQQTANDQNTFHVGLYDTNGFCATFGLSEMDFAFQKEAVKAVADRTAPGETRTEVVDLDQYDPFFYLYGHVYWQNHGEPLYVAPKACITDVSAYLNLSTQSYRATIQVQKDPEGNPIDGQFAMTEDSYTPTILTDMVDHTGYLYVQRTREGPGELHAITFGPDSQNMVQMVDAKLVTILPPDLWATNFLTDGENLLCYGESSGYIYDLDRGEGYLLDHYQPGHWQCYVVENGLYFVENAKFQLYTLEEGRYVPSFHGTFDLLEDWEQDGHYVLHNTVYYLVNRCDFSQFTIQAMAKDGRKFRGDYTLSQSQEQSYVNPNPIYGDWSSHGVGQIILTH